MSVPPAGANPTMMRTAATDRTELLRCATRPAARQRPLPDAEIVFGGLPTVGGLPRATWHEARRASARRRFRALS